VDDGITGLLFRSGSVESLSEKLTFLNQNPDVAEAMGREAYRRYWIDPTDWQRHLRELLACYEGILHLEGTQCA
jgi:glycosyltransferase involved in cell wall biosynthesis